MDSNSRKKVFIVLGIVGLLGLGIWIYSRSKKPKEQKTLKDVFDNLTFETGKDVIKPESYPYLDELANVLVEAKNWKIAITGHTDDVGSDAFNLELSKKRANAVKNYLISKNVSESLITADGKGESMPLVKNDSEENRAKNRRVEFVITKPDNTTIEAKK